MSRVAFLAPFVVVALIGCTPKPAPSVISVEVRWPGASALAIEQALLPPLEQIAQATPKVTTITSTASDGRARVRAVVATDGPLAALTVATNVRARVQEALPRLPRDIEPPMVWQNDGGRPAHRFVATSKTSTLVEQSRVLDALCNQLQRVPGVSRCEVERGARPEWQIDVDTTRAHAVGLTPSEIADKVRDAIGGLGAPLPAAPEEIAGLAVNVQPDGSVVRVRDVAAVAQGVRPSSDEWPPLPGAPPSLIVYRHAEAPADFDERIAGEEMHARSVLGPGYDFARVPFTPREGVAVIVVGHEHAPLRDVARTLQPLVASTKGVHDVAGLVEDKAELTVDLDRARAAALGVRASDVTRAVALSTSGELVSAVGADVPVRVRAMSASRTSATSAPSVELLRDVAVRTANGALVPLDAVTQVRATSTPARLERRNASPALWLCAGVVDDGTQDDVAVALRTALARAPLPAGVSVVVERGCTH